MTTFPCDSLGEGVYSCPRPEFSSVAPCWGCNGDETFTPPSAEINSAESLAYLFGIMLGRDRNDQAACDRDLGYAKAAIEIYDGCTPAIQAAINNLHEAMVADLRHRLRARENPVVRPTQKKVDIMVNRLDTWEDSDA